MLFCLAVEEKEGTQAEDRAGQSLEDPFEHERGANVVVGRSDQLEQLKFVLPAENGETDSVGDHKDGGEDQQGA